MENEDRMYMYVVQAGNPEGFDWTMKLKHKEKFSQEEFTDMCESAILKYYKENKEPFLASASQEVFSYLNALGFDRMREKEDVVSYYIEPYWGLDDVKNAELAAMIRKVTNE